MAEQFSKKHVDNIVHVVHHSVIHLVYVHNEEGSPFTCVHKDAFPIQGHARVPIYAHIAPPLPGAYPELEEENFLLLNSLFGYSRSWSIKIMIGFLK